MSAFTPLPFDHFKVTIDSSIQWLHNQHTPSRPLRFTLDVIERSTPSTARLERFRLTFPFGGVQRDDEPQRHGTGGTCSLSLSDPNEEPNEEPWYGRTNERTNQPFFYICTYSYRWFSCQSLIRTNGFWKVVRLRPARDRETQYDRSWTAWRERYEPYDVYYAVRQSYSPLYHESEPSSCVWFTCIFSISSSN